MEESFVDRYGSDNSLSPDSRVRRKYFRRFDEYLAYMLHESDREAAAVAAHNRWITCNKAATKIQTKVRQVQAKQVVAARRAHKRALVHQAAVELLTDSMSDVEEGYERELVRRGLAATKIQALARQREAKKAVGAKRAHRDQVRRCFCVVSGQRVVCVVQPGGVHVPQVSSVLPRLCVGCTATAVRFVFLRFPRGPAAL